MTNGHSLQLFVGAFIEEMVRSGVSHVCLCPGSRSTPLAILLRKHPSITLWTHVDERSAAFFALGIAKALRQPVAVVSTSGTAAVNFAPAVVEAYYAQVPLLVLTADRPPELRHIGALQTIDQVRLFGAHVKWFVDMPLPDATEALRRYACTIACRAVTIARADSPGPVHVNFPFREPLIPLHQTVPADRALPGLTVTRPLHRPDPADVAALAAALCATQRGLVVCGPQDDPHFPQAVTRVATTLGFPVLADPLSQVRCGAHHNRYVIDSYDAFLRVEELACTLAPEVILRFGATPVSKPLLLYLQRHAACRQILVEGGDGWRDPTLTASEVWQVHPRSLCESLLTALELRPRHPRRETWAERWITVGEQTRTTLHTTLRQRPHLCEPRVFVELAEMLPSGTTVVVGNSMPVRDLDSFFAGHERVRRFLANRGASGIDGVVSMALGVSAVSCDPVVLVIGDLSFYHDLNGLLAARRYQLRATIILLHNDGGGIFSFLPQADDPEHFEELFGTPHGLDFRPVADMYGLLYRRPAGWEEFRTALRQALGAPGVFLIEVRSERHANAALHRCLWDAVTRAVGKRNSSGGGT